MFSSIPIFQSSTASGQTICNITNSHKKSTLPIIPSTDLHFQPSYPQDILPRVVKKILSLEYIEMAELLPEYWGAEEPESPCCRSTLANHPEEVQLQTFWYSWIAMHLWCQSYALYTLTSSLISWPTSELLLELIECS